MVDVSLVATTKASRAVATFAFGALQGAME